MRERVEKARVDAERVERERIEHERAERDRQERERAEKEIREREQAAREHAEREAREQGGARARARRANGGGGRRRGRAATHRRLAGAARSGHGLRAAARRWATPAEPTERAYPIYAPPAETESWTPELEPPPAIEIALLAPAQPSIKLQPSSSPATSIRFQHDAEADATPARADSRRDPVDLSAVGAYEPFQIREEERPIPWSRSPPAWC